MGDVGEHGTVLSAVAVDQYDNRPGIGRINGIHAPAGSLLGPMNDGRYVVVIRNDDGSVVCDVASPEDLRLATLKTSPDTSAEARANIGMKTKADMEAERATY
jgi:hypothetical protein